MTSPRHFPEPVAMVAFEDAENSVTKVSRPICPPALTVEIDRFGLSTGVKVIGG